MGRVDGVKAVQVNSQVKKRLTRGSSTLAQEPLHPLRLMTEERWGLRAQGGEVVRVIKVVSQVRGKKTREAPDLFAHLHPDYLALVYGVTSQEGEKSGKCKGV